MDARVVRGGRPRVGRRTVIPRAVAGAAWDMVFLDRDGTINERRVGGYVDSPDRVVLLPGAAEAVARLTAAGIPVVVVTNQRGLATGRLTWAQFDAVSARVGAALAAAGGRIAHTAVCPHDHGACVCRKPADGMFRAVLREAPWVDPHRCAMVGDMPSDVAPARGLGMYAVHLGPDAPDLAAAVDLLLHHPSSVERPVEGRRESG